MGEGHGASLHLIVFPCDLTVVLTPHNTVALREDYRVDRCCGGHNSASNYEARRDVPRSSGRSSGYR